MSSGGGGVRTATLEFVQILDGARERDDENTVCADGESLWQSSHNVRPFSISQRNGALTRISLLLMPSMREYEKMERCDRPFKATPRASHIWQYSRLVDAAAKRHNQASLEQSDEWRDTSLP